MERPEKYRTYDILFYIFIFLNISIGCVGLLGTYVSKDKKSKNTYFRVFLFSVIFSFIFASVLVPLMFVSDYDFTYTLSNRDKKEKFGTIKKVRFQLRS